MVDAMVTLVTWLPLNLYLSIYYANEDYFVSTYTRRERFAFEAVLFGLMLTNCFTSPFVYYYFNLAFRVSQLQFFFKCNDRKALF